jgi:hypothetical protein
LWIPLTEKLPGDCKWKEPLDVAFKSVCTIKPALAEVSVMLKPIPAVAFCVSVKIPLPFD